MRYKYKNFKYMENIQYLLDAVILTDDQENEFIDIYDKFKKKELNKGYVFILKDLYILTKVHNFSNKQLGLVYGVSADTISLWLKESGIIKVLKSGRGADLDIEANKNYDISKPKKKGCKDKLELKDFIYKEKERAIINATIFSIEDEININKLKETTMNTKYSYVYKDIYKMFKRNYTPDEIASVYGKCGRTIQLLLKKSGLSRNRLEAQAIAKTKRDYKEIQIKGKKTMNENLTMINGSSYEQYTRNLLSYDLALKFKYLESIVGVNNKSVLDDGKEIDIPIIIIGYGNILKLAIEYDGDFWHKDGDRDKLKEKLIRDKGYKMFRIAPKSNITDKQIKNEIKIVLDEIYNYISTFFNVSIQDVKVDANWKF